MRIKKKTSIMLLASTAAAVVGISAVSFAAWNTTGKTSVTANASAGTAYLFGFNDDNAALSFDTDLVPYNQKAETIKTGATSVYAVIPDYTVFKEGYEINVKISSTDITGATFYVLMTESDPTGTDGKKTFDGTPDTTAAIQDVWKTVDATDGFTFTYDAPTAENTTVSGKYLYVAMDSTNREHAGKSFTVVVTLVAKNAQA